MSSTLPSANVASRGPGTYSGSGVGAGSGVAVATGALVGAIVGAAAGAEASEEPHAAISVVIRIVVPAAISGDQSRLRTSIEITQLSRVDYIDTSCRYEFAAMDRRSYRPGVITLLTGIVVRA